MGGAVSCGAAGGRPATQLAPRRRARAARPRASSSGGGRAAGPGRMAEALPAKGAACNTRVLGYVSALPSHGLACS